MKVSNKVLARKKRHWRIRKKVVGTPDKPRMYVCRTLRYMYVQIIDDLNNKTLITCGTNSKDFKSKYKDQKNNIKTASILGELVAEKVLAKGVKKVVFDRSGYKYHGRVKALAESARKKGLKF